MLMSRVRLGALMALTAILAACQEEEAPPAGPACPVTAPAEVGGALKPTKFMDFEGITFARRFGDAECGFDNKRLVCRFTSPAVLEVKTKVETYVFAPGIGQPAMVSVRKGVASCVMTPKSTG